MYEWLKEIENAERNDFALELDSNLSELRVLRIRRQAMAVRNRASLSAAEGLRAVLLEMAETYERIAESAEQRRQAPGPQSHPSP
ncbi:MAG: hypothetical protein WA863_10735 [Methyloceanibacter sp.]